MEEVVLGKSSASFLFLHPFRFFNFCPCPFCSPSSPKWHITNRRSTRVLASGRFFFIILHEVRHVGQFRVYAVLGMGNWVNYHWSK